MRDFDIMAIEVEDVLRDLNDYSWTWYGVGGFGKSQICASLYQDPCFWCWEEGAKAIRAKKFSVPSWKFAKEQLKKLQKAYKEGKPMPFKTAIMDTVDLAHKRCAKWVCEQNGWDDISDGEWGAGYTALKEEFDNFMSDLESLGIKPVYISHDKDKEFKPKKGDKYNQTIPAIGTGGMEVIYDKPDFCVYCSIDKEKDKDGNEIQVRRMYFRNNGDFKTKSRLMYMPEFVEYGATPREASDLIKEAFAKAVIEEFGEADGDFQPKEKKKTEIKESKKSEKKVEKTEEKTEKVKEKAPKTENTAKDTENLDNDQSEDMNLDTLKAKLNDRLLSMYQSGEKTQVEIVDIIKGATSGLKKVSEITSLDVALNLKSVIGV